MQFKYMQGTVSGQLTFLSRKAPGSLSDMIFISSLSTTLCSLRMSS